MGQGMRGDATKNATMKVGEAVIIARIWNRCGFSLKSQANEVFAVVGQLVDGLMHIGQGSVALLLLEG